MCDTRPYAALFAAIGSAVEQESDAQYLMLPAMLPLFAAYITAVMAIQNPEGQVAVIGSFVPLTAPILMLIRLPLGVAWWELVLSLLGVLATAYGFCPRVGADFPHRNFDARQENHRSGVVPLGPP